MGAPCHLVNRRLSLYLPVLPSQVLILTRLVSSPSGTTGSPTPPAPPRTRVTPGAPPTPPWLVPTFLGTLGTALLLALGLRGVVVHLVPHTLWTVTPVSVELMGILSVQVMTVAQLLPLPQPLLLLPLPLPHQQLPQPP